MAARWNARALLALVAATTGCGVEPAAVVARPLILIGVDGLEWELLLRFAGEEQLPNLSALAKDGLAAKLDTLEETLSPLIWTTIATGKRPEKHGITAFSFEDESGTAFLFTSLHRKSKALWNLFTDAGLTTDVFGWWCTFPAEEIQGEMVAQTSTRAQIDIASGSRIWKGNYLAGLPRQTWPDELSARMDAHARALAEQVIAGADPAAAAFGKPAHAVSKLDERLFGLVRSAFYADVLFREAALDVLKEKRPFDALLVYFGVVDVASHLFWRPMEPQKYDHPPSAESIADFGRVIRDSYRWVDEAIGEIRRLAPDADLLVVSDHGFYAASLHDEFKDDGPRHDSGKHTQSPPGVLIAAGPGFRRDPLPPGATADELKTIGRVEDLLPTLLARAGLPYGEDMDGRPLRRLLADEVLRAHPIGSVKSHEDDAWRVSREEALARFRDFERNFETLLRQMDEKNLETLRALGYTGAGLNEAGPEDDPPPKEPPAKDSPQDRKPR